MKKTKKIEKNNKPYRVVSLMELTKILNTLTKNSLKRNEMNSFIETLEYYNYIHFVSLNRIQLRHSFECFYKNELQDLICESKRNLEKRIQQQKINKNVKKMIEKKCEYRQDFQPHQNGCSECGGFDNYYFSCKKGKNSIKGTDICESLDLLFFLDLDTCKKCSMKKEIFVKKIIKK